MAVNYVNPRVYQSAPDPILTNVMQDLSGEGDWFAPIGCPVKPVSKDNVRWGKADSQSLLSNLFETLRAPGSRYNLIPRPKLEWVTSLIQDNAVRVEYYDEDVVNSVNPNEPRITSAKKILNVLQLATEIPVQALYHAAASTAAAGSAWSGAAGSIRADIEGAKLAILKNTGAPANFVVIPPSKLPGLVSSTELMNMQVFYPNNILAVGGYPTSLFGLRLFMPGARSDTTPTGTFTPAFVWDTNLEAYVGYSPTLDGGSWDGDGPAYCMQFENQLAGTAYEARERLDPNYDENRTHIVYGDVRRSTPEAHTPGAVFRITAI